MSGICEYLCRTVPKPIVDSWFGDAEIADMTGDTCVIRTTARFKKDMIQSRYVASLQDALRELFGRTYNVSIAFEEGAASASEGDGGSDRSEFSFDRFVVGESNRFAAAAARAVADSPGKVYNPLFLYGPSGMGKTHLLYAIMNQVKKEHPEYIIRAFSAEQFTNELVSAIQNKDTSEFHEKYRQADLLLIDDIQFIAGRDFSQTEFFHTFNILYEQGHQIVLTSDRPPRQFDFKMLEERLITRFEWGLTVDIKPPDLETRVAIVRSKAQRLGMMMPDAVAEYIARTMTANVRQLEGTVKKIMAHRDLMNKEVSIETAEEAIGDLIRENPGLNPTPPMIISAVCSFYRLDERQLLGKGRQADLVMARQMSMYLIRSLTAMSLDQIGDKVFGRDHTTVMHAIKQVEARRSVDASFDNDVKTIIENIRGN